MEQKKQIKLIIIGIVILVLGFGVAMAFVIKENSQCTTNPLVYGANKVRESEGVGLMCSCSFNDPRYEDFIFNETEISIKQSPKEFFLPEIDKTLKVPN